MKSLGYLLLGVLISIMIAACASGGKSLGKIDYDDFPLRSAEFTAWMKCKDGDLENVCKYECTKYNNKNECKQGHERIVRMNTKKALDNDFVLISKPFFLQLISN